MAFNPKDYYFKKAKKDHFVARSVYKLEEIDERYRLIQVGNKVIDLGCSPGSWSQYASKKIGPQGKLLGVDLKPTRVNLPNAKFVVANLLDQHLETIITETGFELPADVVLSDMAPSTTGIRVTDQARSLELCEMALDCAIRFLRPGGNFVCKLFHSEAFDTFRNKMKAQFKNVEVLKPKSTRKESKEIFLIGKGFSGRPQEKSGS